MFNKSIAKHIFATMAYIPTLWRRVKLINDYNINIIIL